MINPNICKMVYVVVSQDRTSAMYKGQVLSINDYKFPAPKPGNRRMYLKYSTTNNRYYLTTKP